MTADSPQQPLRLAILLSGGGRTMLNLASEIAAGRLHAQIVCVISSRADAPGIARARELNLPVHIVERKHFPTPEAFSDALWTIIRAANTQLVCLAGFLSLLTIPPDYHRRVINIHPALLPAHGGKGMFGHHVHQAVLAAGDSETGCTVHYCDNRYDTGPIILQRRCPVLPHDTPDTLAARVFEEECKAYPEAIRMLQRWRASRETVGRASRPPSGDLESLEPPSNRPPGPR